jgi:hypothetical protein
MSRHTTFKFCLDPNVEQRDVLARHAGAARFAFNQCLATVKTALTQRKTDGGVVVPWTGFDLINVFNGWKKTEDAGRVLVVDTDGVAEVLVTGLPWRWPEPFPMPAGPNSPGSYATNRPGAAANSLSRIAGTRRASSARPAAPSAAI